MKEFILNENTSVKLNDRYWTFSINSCHASLALRKDYLEQLKRVHDELGFERVRFHGVFNDDMKVITRLSDFISAIPSSKKVKTTSFYHIALVFDELLKIGIKPFVEISFMPPALAKSKKTVFYYKGNITPPKDYDEWKSFIKSFVSFLIDRYGREEVESWYFEIWNEPNLKYFFFWGSQNDYFKLYSETVSAIKAVDGNIKVGGPATSENKWLPEMKNYCKKNSVPLDFLSTHHYPGDDIGLPIFTPKNLSRMALTATKNKSATVHYVVNKMMYQEEKLPLIPKDSMHKQAIKARGEAGDTPLYYTEWNVFPTCTAPLHDTAQAASYIIKHIMECQYIMDGCSYWTFSDIYEELTFFTKPFSGVFGLMNINGIPKPNYWAFYLLNRLEKNRLDLETTHDDVEIAVFRDDEGKKVQFLLYHQNYILDQGNNDKVTITYNTGKSVKSAKVLKIDKDNCNPLDYWRKMNSPEYLTQQQVEEIKAATCIKEQPVKCEKSDNAIVIQTEIGDNGIQLFEVELSD